ncbi:MAG: pirin family protein [Gammaproteobacteria bacterium]|jgi:redox-sensitive bicupin YhaK (pirin superfamily)|nr:pirin family protein [Gammaproteobacteria bacterium]
MEREPRAEAFSNAIETILIPRTADLGEGLRVQRALPVAGRRMVGPFIFFDRLGPARFGPRQGMDVRPHPHIGLATVTYLFSGELMHRDSLGCAQVIRPGEVNWMTAGRGIVHSERTPPERRDGSELLSGIQTWVALPRDHEEAMPAFVHRGSGELPLLEDEGVHARLIAGELSGARSPVPAASPMFYADIALERGATFVLTPTYTERALFVIEGVIEVMRKGRFGIGRMLVFRPGGTIELRASEEPARLVLLGGEPLDGARHIWWNFVSSSRERIRQAAADWRDGRFPRVAGDDEFIPLPATKYPREVDYP